MDQPGKASVEGRTLEAIAVGTWGACGGLFLSALALTGWILSSRLHATFHPAIIPGPGPLESCATVPWQEIFEKRLFGLQVLFCPLLAWLALRLRRRPSGWACLVSFLLFVPTIFEAYREAFQAAPRLPAFLAAGLLLGIPWVRWGAWLGRLSPAASLVPRRLLLALLLEAVLFLTLFPLRPAHFANILGTNVHTSSYFVGPSLYYLSPGMVPGLDFESQYGVGHAYVFSFFLGKSFHAALFSQVLIMFVVLSFYYQSALAVLSRFLDSGWAALLAVFLLVATGMEAESYCYPSSWPVRYPFLFLFIACAAEEQLLRRAWLPAALAGALAGLSLFWQTDVGLVLGLAGTVYYVVLLVRERRGLARVPLFLAAAGGTFALLALLAFGPRTLSPLFARRLLEPPLLYASNFGCWPMNWTWGWPYLYNVIAPAVSLACLGWALQQLPSADGRERRTARYLILLGGIGLLMLVKWVNRSLDNLWAVNAPTVIVMLFWCLRSASAAWGERLATRLGVEGRAGAGLLRPVTGLAVLFGVLGLAVFVSLFHNPNGQQAGRSTSPLVRLLTFSKDTPTPLNRLLVRLWDERTGALYDTCKPVRVDGGDVEFIRRRTAPTEPVTIVSWHDWMYLAEARRAPRLYWVPTYYTHTRMQLERVEKTFRASPILFVQRNDLDFFRQTNPQLCERLMRIVREQYTLIDSSKNLDLYRRKAASGL